MSTIEGDGDADVCDDDEVKKVVVAGNRDGLFVNEGWDARSVSKSPNGHQSNVENRGSGVVD